MANLRDEFFRAPTVSLDEMEQLHQSDMGSLRRGWEAGRIGTERNALGIDESAARAAGDLQQADTLRGQNEALAQAQQRVAPRVQRVEDINGVSDGMNWFGGQVGQGAASMAEPIAAATALGAVGAVAGRLPGSAGMVGKAVGNFGGPLAAYGINQRQLAGEFYNDASQDQELMARTSPQDLHNTANMYGAAAGALDTVLPALVGRQFAGAGLRAGLKGMGPGATAALGTVGEGVTELGQDMGSKYTQGLLNPNRDTGGDASDHLNSFAGGMAGGGPVSAAGAYADAGYRRLGSTAEQIGAKAGEVIDLAREGYESGRQKIQGAYEGSALERGVDAAGEKAKGLFNRGKGEVVDLYESAKDADGKINLGRAVDLAGQEATRRTEEFLGAGEQGKFTLDDETRDILAYGTDATVPVPEHILNNPDPTATDRWHAQSTSTKGQKVLDLLDDLAGKGDADADRLAARVADEGFFSPAVDEGTMYLTSMADRIAFQSKSDMAYAAAGKLGGMAARAVGKGAVVAGRAVAGAAADMWAAGKGEYSKKNAQGEDVAATAYAAWRERTGRAAADKLKTEMDASGARTRAVNDAPGAREAIQTRAIDIQRRAELFGETLVASPRSCCENQIAQPSLLPMSQKVCTGRSSTGTVVMPPRLVSSVTALVR